MTISGLLIVSHRWPIRSSGVGFSLRGPTSLTSERVLASSCALFNFLFRSSSLTSPQTEIRAGITTWVRVTRHQRHQWLTINILPLGRNGIHCPSSCFSAWCNDLTYSPTQKISVNASILSDSGGTCECPTGDGCVSDPTYLACVNEIRTELITTTAAISALSSFLMGLLANLPVGMAPGLGLNAYVRIKSSSPYL